MVKYGKFFYQNDSEWPVMDFKHNIENCNERLYFICYNFHGLNLNPDIP